MIPGMRKIPYNPRPRMRKPIMTPEGQFESRDAAAEHYRCAGPNMNYFLWRYPDKFYYLSREEDKTTE